MQVKQLVAELTHVAQLALQAPPQVYAAPVAKNSPAVAHSHFQSVHTGSVPILIILSRFVLSQVLQCF